MSVNRFYDAENVLPDGRVFVLGGEYNVRHGTQVWTNTGEIYNPVTNTWTTIANFPEPHFGGPTMLLPDGRVLAGSMNWPANLHLRSGHEHLVGWPDQALSTTRASIETWTKLPDGSILSYDI